jgi:stress-induced morphogen
MDEMLFAYVIEIIDKSNFHKTLTNASGRNTFNVLLTSGSFVDKSLE